MGDNEEVHYERERSRSRDRVESREYQDDEVRGAGSVGSQQDDNNAGFDDSRNNRNESSGRRHEEDPDVNNLYVTNLSFQTTDESLRAAFQQFGEIHNAAIIKEPVSQNSRGFGFVSFFALEDCEKALAAMHGADLDGRSIRVEKARRNNGYQKTPGVYLGPPQLSARFVRGDERGPRDRGYGGDRPHGGGGYRGGGGGYDRDRDPRDVRGGDRGYGGGGGYMGHRGEDSRYPPAYQRGPPGGGYGDRGPPMYRDEGRYQPEPRFEPYGRGRDGPPPQRFDDRGPPPRGAYYDGPRGGPPMNGGPMGPGPNMRGRPGRSRSPPPRGGDDSRGPMPINGGAPGGPGYDRNGPPSGGYGGGAGYYPPGQSGPGGPPRGGARY